MSENNYKTLNVLDNFCPLLVFEQNTLAKKFLIFLKEAPMIKFSDLI